MLPYGDCAHEHLPRTKCIMVDATGFTPEALEDVAVMMRGGLTLEDAFRRVRRLINMRGSNA